jgi:YbbR domain-containing protein
MDQWLRNTNVVKVLALVIGIMLWAVVHMDDNTMAGTSANGVREEQISNVSVTPRSF